MKVVKRCPKGLSCLPACQIETLSAFHVSTGPTLIALVGTSAMFPPPLVRAFCAIVSGCRSTTRVANFRYSSAEGGESLSVEEWSGGAAATQADGEEGVPPATETTTVG